jgi:ABC-type sugar transport system ATPase subunit
MASRPQPVYPKMFLEKNLTKSVLLLVLRRGEKVGERHISQTNHDEVVRLMVAG